MKRSDVMRPPTGSELIDAIATAARRAFLKLFKNHPGQYYYCSLVTTGEAHVPALAAWSEEALEAAIAEDEDPEEARQALKWSCADSPFYCFGDEFFEPVKRLFDERPQLTSELMPEVWDAEYQFRIDAMEAAMFRLDSEGLFGTGAARHGTVVLVEVVPPDYTNTERAMRLNPQETLREWLEEASEEE